MWKAVDTVHDRETGTPLYTQIAWTGDILFHVFADPADWPELPPATVEEFNRPYRAIYNAHMAQATVFSKWADDIWRQADMAGWRMELVRARRRNPDAKRFHVNAFGIEGGCVIGP